MATDGAVHRLIVNELETRGLSSWIPSQHARALLTHASSDAGSLHTALGRKRVKETQRLGRRLADLGRVEYDQLERAEDVNGGVDEFLALESGGWKGRERTALACDPQQREFFRSIIHTSFANDHLMALSLRLNGRAIAMKCSFVTMGAAFAFKMAYDEGFGKYSPGVLLEIENVRRFDRRADLRWMDSCADPDHSMIDSLWPERRPIETLLVGLGPRAGAEAFIFMSSPGSITPYHIDPEYNFLLQVRGWKVVHMFNGASRDVLPEESLEAFYVDGATRNPLPHQPSASHAGPAPEESR